MSTFGGLILTNRGRNLQSKAQAGTTIQYTRIALGDGSLGSTSILNLNTLISQKKSLSITKLRVLSGGRAVVGAVLSNQEMTEGFYFRELGVFATDPDLGEILYCYGNAGALAEYIPPGGGSDVIEKNIDVQTLVGNAQNVTAIIDGSLVYVTQEQLDEVIGSIDAPTTTQFNQLSQTVDANKQEVTAHLAEKASKTEFGHVMVGDGLHVEDGVISADELDAQNVTLDSPNFTSNNVKGAMDELFQYGSDGKTVLETKVISKGGTVSKQGSVATFDELNTGIDSLPSPIAKFHTKLSGVLQSGIGHLYNFMIGTIDNDMGYNFEEKLQYSFFGSGTQVRRSTLNTSGTIIVTETINTVPFTGTNMRIRSYEHSRLLVGYWNKIPPFILDYNGTILKQHPDINIVSGYPLAYHEEIDAYLKIEVSSGDLVVSNMTGTQLARVSLSPVSTGSTSPSYMRKITPNLYMGMLADRFCVIGRRSNGTWTVNPVMFGNIHSTNFIEYTRDLTRMLTTFIQGSEL